MPNQPRKKTTVYRVLGLAVEIPPVAYVAITGTAPTWIRAWLSAWLTVWLLSTVIAAARAVDQTTN